MTLQEFKNKYNGKAIDYDGAYGNQCVDLMNQYCVEVLGIQNPIQVLGGSTAYEIYQNYNGSQFIKTLNTPTGVPQAGDIVFWDTTIGSAGHVAIFVSGDQNNFTSFDQNWPVGSLCHEQVHNYNGVVGWLHSNISQTVSVDSATFQTLVTKSTAYDAFVAGGYKSIDDVNSKVNSLQSTIDNENQTINDRNNDIVQLKAQNATLQTQLTASQDQVTTLTPIAASVPNLKEQLAQALNDRQLCLNKQGDTNKKIANLEAQIAAGKPKGFVNRLIFLLGK